MSLGFKFIKYLKKLQSESIFKLDFSEKKSTFLPDIWGSGHVRHCTARKGWVLIKRKDAIRGVRVASWYFFDCRKLFWTKSDLSGGCQAVRENEASYQKTLSIRFLLSMVRSGQAMFQRMLQFSVGCKRSGTPPAKIVRHRCPALPGGVAPIFRSRMKSVSG